MNAPTLYSISGQLAQLLDAIEEGGGELTPEIDQALTITEGQFADKATDYGLAILNLDAMAAAAKSEKDRLAKLQKFYENTAKTLRARLSGAMQALDHPKVETPTLRLFLRHSVSTEIDDIDLVPKEFKTAKVEMVADKAAIKAALQDGQEVPGARLQENVSLQIK